MEERGLSYRTLGVRVHYAKSHMHDLASGRAAPTPDAARLIDLALGAGGTLVRLARSSRSPTLTTSVTEPAAPRQCAALPDELRRQLITLSPPPQDETAPALYGIESAVRQAHDHYQRAHYGHAAVQLPGLLAWALWTVETGRPAARRRSCRVLATANLAASKIAAKVGDADLAWLAADRAVQAARQADDDALRAVASYQVAAALLKRPSGAEDAAAVLSTAIGAASQGSASPAYVSARGALRLLAAVVAARLGDARYARMHLDEAARLAALLDEDANQLWTAFNAANVRLHELAVAISLGQPGRALELGESVDMRALPTALAGRRAQYHVDLASAHAMTGRSDADALLHLLEAERLAPEAVRVGHAARTVITALVGRPRHAAGLVALADRAGVAA
jgi:hypothetical protein